MPDPFTFDPERVLHIYSPECSTVFLYRTPDGPISEDFDTMYFEHRAFGPVCVMGATKKDALAAAIHRLKEQFEDRVAGLSAHDRLRWIATARGEGRM